MRQKKDWTFEDIWKICRNVMIGILIVILCGFTVSWLYGCYYDVRVDGTSWRGAFQDGVYYYKAENKIYSWTPEEGRRETTEFPASMSLSAETEAKVRYGSFSISRVSGAFQEDAGYHLYYRKNDGAEPVMIKEGLSESSQIVSDGTYLVLYTGRYHDRRQAKTECYEIEYDEKNRAVKNIVLADVFYDLND